MTNGLKIVVLVIALFAFGCHKEPETGISFEVPIPTYSLSRFVTNKPFLAKLSYKRIGEYSNRLSNTNCYVALCLEKTHGDQLAIIQNPAPYALFVTASSMRTNQSYEFPDAIIKAPMPLSP